MVVKSLGQDIKMCSIDGIKEACRYVLLSLTTQELLWENALEHQLRSGAPLARASGKNKL